MEFPTTCVQYTYRMNSVSRRAVAKGAVWATPTIMVGSPAPAVAASCTPAILDWDTQPVGVSSASISIGATAPVTVTHSVAYGAGVTPGTNSDQVQAGPMSGVPGNWWRLGMGSSSAPIQSGWAASVTWRFSKPVKNLAFTILDIDYVANGGVGWSDRVWLSDSFVITGQGANVSGVGTQANPWNSTVNTNAGANDAGNRVSVRYAGPISTFVVSYQAGDRAAGASNMHIGLSDLSFCV